MPKQFLELKIPIRYLATIYYNMYDIFLSHFLSTWSFLAFFSNTVNAKHDYCKIKSVRYTCTDFFMRRKRTLKIISTEEYLHLMC